jgi:formylglycine-generating enzyme required for sulfatase activity
VVYLVRNRLMGRNEVLKVMGRHLVERPEVSERFLREIRAVASLRHPNIVAAHHAFHVDKTIALTMEYVEGYDLSKMVKARGPLPVAHACLFAHQAALGLQHAHEEGMVHRDIKPGNLMVSRRGEKAVVKVLDFGLAKAAREGRFDAALTHAGQMLGTPDFIAPEQIRDAQSADIRADIYSLGCTLYYLLTGGPPFQGTSLYDILQAHHSRDALPLNLARPEVPVELAALVAKMMAKEPKRRFQTPAEVSKALTPFFKPGTNPGSRQRPEISRVGQAVSSPQPIGLGAAPARPATPGTIPAPAPRGTSKLEGVARESLIEFKQAGTVKEPAPAVEAPRRQRPPWVWPVIAAAFSFALITLGVIIYVTTDYGRIKIIIDGPKADVQVDGQKVLIKTPRESFVNTIGMKLALIPAGEFFMGSPDDSIEAEKHEKPSHRVRINKPFYLGVTEVTRGQFRRFVDAAGYQTHAERDGEGGWAWNNVAKRWEHDQKFTWLNPGFEQTDEHPVVIVSWEDAVAFAEWLAREEHTTYRLPTEAEWEYACRAGSTTRYSFGDDEARLGEYAWFDGNSENKTHPVGQKRPNAFGLYDMPGNVWELCADWYDEKYYASSPAADPPGATHASLHVIRGGSWFYAPFGCRPAFRRTIAPGHTGSITGFRVALDQSETPKALKSNISSEPTKTAGGTAGLPARQAPKKITNSIGMGLALIPAGEFFMGSPDDAIEAEKIEKPSHRVRISRPFYLGICEVTQAQYEAVMGNNPSHFSANGGGKDQIAGQSTDRYPVENVSWRDAIQFSNKLSGKEGKKPFYEIDEKDIRVPDWNGPGYRLPTEAEWEYACRANESTPTRFSFGDNAVELGLYGWVPGNSEQRTHLVGQKQPNGFGLYDMHGNAFEWCWDWFGEGYYIHSPADDPTGPAEGSDRAIRGGNCTSETRCVRSAARHRCVPGNRGYGVGFRLALGQSGR